jgi:fatty-acyl-CoA synthase
MLGLMQRRELLISTIITHAARHHADAEVVSRRDDGHVCRTTYAGLERRARRLASLLRRLEVRQGDRVATLAMNSDRHLEAYYAISGIGAICHTINPRLSAEDICYVVRHAEDRVILVDPRFLPIIAAYAATLAGVLREIVVLCEAPEVPQIALPAGMTVHCYEALMTQATAIPEWPIFDENSASALCYTSGTTGRPKGVLYSHRSTILYAMMMASADALSLRAVDRVLPAVPMFHVNAWGLPYVAPMVGASLVFPGRQLDPAALLKLMNDERVTFAAGVPTVWLGIAGHLRQTGEGFATLQRVLSGGAAFPRALMAEYAQSGVDIIHAWGMTESSPVTTICAPKPSTSALDADARLDQRATQGRTVFGVDVDALDDGQHSVPWDGKTQGNLVFRGHWVAKSYYRQSDTEVGPDGWFPTGDVGFFDTEGFVTLTDRTKDLIKSGGEWISSIVIENIAVAHPEVAEAAAIAVPHEKWGERPILIVVPRPHCSPLPDQIRRFFDGKLPSWQLPDRVVITDALPHGATGKVLKAELRRKYASAF